jgi:hypothetical protein
VGFLSEKQDDQDNIIIGWVGIHREKRYIYLPLVGAGVCIGFTDEDPVG